MGKEKTVKFLLRTFMDPYDESLANYILEHPEDYFDEEFLDDLKDKIEWLVVEEIDRAESAANYEWSHINDNVTLDRTRGEMHFKKGKIGYKECVVPAYWYRGNMSEEEINRKLSFYKKVWADVDYADDVKYPILMSWHNMREWESTFGKDYPFHKMERDLECCDTEEAKELYEAYTSGYAVFRIEDIYPYKLKKVVNVKNMWTDDGGDTHADMTLKLRDGTQCTVSVTLSKYGRITGMRALGPKGFPLMTERDNRLIIKEGFGKEPEIGRYNSWH